MTDLLWAFALLGCTSLVSVLWASLFRPAHLDAGAIAVVRP